MAIAEQQSVYRDTLDKVVKRLQDLGVDSSSAEKLVKKAIDIYSKNGPINNAIIGDYKPSEVRAVLAQEVRPYVHSLRDSNNKR